MHFKREPATMSVQTRAHITPGEYLEIERQAEYKSEYYNGEIFAMSGGSINHSLIAANVTSTLHRLLEGSGCRVFSSDLRIHIPIVGLFTYPDVSVICGQPEVLDDQRDTVLNPILLVEVLSPSTEKYDRGQKFLFYRSIPSLREYLLVAQDRRSAELFRRNEAGIWELHEPDRDGRLELTSVGCAIGIDDVYAGVVMEEHPPLR
jgi:Uma2 family endonuclease